MARVVGCEEERNALQQSLDGLVEWSDKWGMEFNVSKCKVMHLGRHNKQFEYFMGGQTLANTEEERDLGVVMSNKLKPAAQCAKAAQVAMAVLCQITHTFQHRDKHVFLQLYKQYVRPHLEFSVQAWNPWLVGDIELLEKVQRRAVSFVQGLKSKEYEGRLKEVCLLSLEERRHQADMHLVYKMLRDGGENTMFEMAASGRQCTRNASGPLNVRVKHGRLDLRGNFFAVRVTEKWNRIPVEIKSVSTIEKFKEVYKKFRE